MGVRRHFGLSVFRLFYMLERQEELRRYDSIEFKTGKAVEGFMAGLHKSPFHGFSVEFAEHRFYNSGESTKHIDWKLFAKTDKLFVKKYEAETNLRCMLVLDTSSSMYFPYDRKADFKNPTKFSFSVYAAACLCHLFYKQRDAFALSLVSENLEYYSETGTSFAHKQHIFTLFEQILSEKTKNKTTGIDKALHKLAEVLHKRSLVIIFTDLFSVATSADELIESLQHLTYNKHEVILFYVCDKAKEIELDYKERPYRFIDVESGEEVKLTPSEIRDKYCEEVKAKAEYIRNQCNNMKIDFIEADINKGFDQIMLPYLLKRSRLK